MWNWSSTFENISKMRFHMWISFCFFVRAHTLWECTVWRSLEQDSRDRGTSSHLLENCLWTTLSTDIHYWPAISPSFSYFLILSFFTDFRCWPATSVPLKLPLWQSLSIFFFVSVWPALHLSLFRSNSLPFLDLALSLSFFSLILSISVPSIVFLPVYVYGAVNEQITYCKHHTASVGDPSCSFHVSLSRFTVSSERFGDI